MNIAAHTDAIAWLPTQAAQPSVETLPCGRTSTRSADMMAVDGQMCRAARPHQSPHTRKDPRVIANLRGLRWWRSRIPEHPS